MSQEAWIVVGASSSVAREFARVCAKEGHHIIAAGRDLEDLERTAGELELLGSSRARAVLFDATKYDEHALFVEKCKSEFAGHTINLFVCFGSMIDQRDCEEDLTHLRTMTETNFLGVASLLESFAAPLQHQGAGHVVVLGSVAGDRGRRSNYHYGATKAALHTYLQGYRARMFKYGVHVMTVKPGFLDTAMTWGLPGLFLVESPVKFARKVMSGARKGPDTLYLPWFWFVIMTIIRFIPERFFKKMNI